MFMLLAIMGSMFVPVWQSAVNRALDVEFRTISSTLNTLEEQQRLLRSQIAQKAMPEALAEGAWREDILLQQIDADTLVMVGRKNCWQGKGAFPTNAIRLQRSPPCVVALLFVLQIVWLRMSR